MLQVKRYVIEGHQRIKLALFSDIHFCVGYKRKILEDLYQNVKTELPDYILIPGDIIDDTHVLDDVEARDYFLQWFCKLNCLKIPIFIALGGHDFIRKGSDGKHHNMDYDYRVCWFQSIQELTYVYVFTESIKSDKQLAVPYEDQKVCISAYVPSYEYYYQDVLEDKSLKKQELQQFSYRIHPNKVNILLCHTPEYLLDQDLFFLECIQKMDIVVSGHMHNGLIPRFLDHKGNIGLIAPTKYWLPKYSRGHIVQEHLHLFITGGVIKFSKMAPTICRMFHFLYPVSIDYIFVKQ